VLLFADIGSGQSSSVDKVFQKMGDTAGNFFGLFASRPNELPQRGRQFGGGHGVFSFYLVNGVDGAADSDHDGFVEVKELVDYVSMQVPLATVNTQHPHEYGAYGMYWRLSDLSKPGIELP
jgi:hypothetical protein